MKKSIFLISFLALATVQGSAMAQTPAQPRLEANAVLPVEDLKSVLPAAFKEAGYSSLKREVKTQLGGYGDYQVSNVIAVYELELAPPGGGAPDPKLPYEETHGQVQIQITDVGAQTAAAMSLMPAMSSNQTTDTGYEKAFSENGRLISEAWDTETKVAQYGVFYNNRVHVEIISSSLDIATVKTILTSIDVAPLLARLPPLPKSPY